MENKLNDYEIQLHDRFIRSTMLTEAKSIPVALRNFITDDKEKIMADLNLDERDFRAFHAQTVNNIFEFLKSNEFVGEREGNVIFITEKGKHLRKAGSIAEYEVWQKETRAKNKKVIQTIETRGYLDQDQIVRNRRALIVKRIKKFIVYPLLLLILVFFLLLGAHHYNLDKDVPFIRNLFKSEKPAAGSKAKKHDVGHKKKAGEPTE